MSSELEVVSKAIALTPQQRAIAVFSHIVEADLETLAAALKDVTTITNADGYQQVHAGRMRLKNERVGIEKAGKAGREEATRISKAIIAEEDRLVAITSAEEKRLQGLQDAWDAKIELERQAKIDAELKRVADLQERVATLRGCQILHASSGSALISEHIADIEKIAVDDSFQEFQQQAEDAKTAGLARLRSLYTAAVAHETEQARITAEREELARLREAEQLRQAQERKRLEEEERRAKAARDAEATRHADQLRQQREEQEAANRVERQRIADEEEAAKKVRDAEAARLAEERAELARQQETLRKLQEPSAPITRRGNAILPPSAQEIIDVLSKHYRAHPDTIIDWLRKTDFNQERAA